MEFGNKGMLATLGLVLPSDQMNLVRTTDKQARDLAASGVADLLDPGIRPILEEGPTPFNIGMLALGTIAPGSGKVVGLASRRAAKEGKRIGEMVDKLRKVNAVRPDLEEKHVRAAQEYKRLSEAKSPFEVGMTPNQMKEKSAGLLSQRDSLAEAAQDKADEWGDLWGRYMGLSDESKMLFRDRAREGYDEAVANLDLIERAREGDNMALKGLESLGIKTEKEFAEFMAQQRAIVDTFKDLEVLQALDGL